MNRRFLIKLFAIFPFINVSNLFANDDVEFTGDVLVNGKAVTQKTKFKPGDEIETLNNGAVKFKINKDAFSLRSNTKFKIENTESKTFTLLTGGVLAVFGRGKVTLKAPTVVAGIRGTGMYVEVEDSGNTTYACTCYGEIKYNYEGGEEVVKASHHDRPFRFKRDGERVVVEDAVMEKHTDEELILLEAMQERRPPFVDSYEMFIRGFKKLFGLEYKNDMY